MCGQNYANMEHRGPPLGIGSKLNEKRLQCTVGKFVHFYAVVIVICIKKNHFTVIMSMSNESLMCLSLYGLCCL